MTEHLDYHPFKDTNMIYGRNHHGGGFASMYGYLKQFARGLRGEPFERNSPLYDLYRDLFNSSVSFPGSTSGRKIPDGGSPNSASDFEDDDLAGIVQIGIYDNYLPIDDGFFPDDPLYLGYNSQNPVGF